MDINKDILSNLRDINHTPIIYISIAICLVAFIILLVIISVYNKWKDMNYLIPFLCTVISLFLLVACKAYHMHLYDEAAEELISNIRQQQTNPLDILSPEALTEGLSKLDLNNYEIRYFNKYCKLNLQEKPESEFDLLSYVIVL